MHSRPWDQLDPAILFDFGFYWPTIFKDAWRICSTCEPCQRIGDSLSWRQQMPQQPMLFCEVFDVCGIDFMGRLSLSLLVLFIFSLLIMFQNGWKPKPPELTMLRLSWILLDLICFAGLESLKPSLVIKHPLLQQINVCLAQKVWGCAQNFHTLPPPKLKGRLRFQTGR